MAEIRGSAGGDRVAQQIEATADYYPPATYAELLSYYDSLILSADPASGTFFPLTATNTRWGEKSILFAVGVIPPAANVTGRLLDRTASIPLDGVTEPVGTEQETAAAKSGAAKNDGPPTAGKNAPSHKAARQTVIDAFTELYGRPPTLPELQYAQAVGWAETSYGRGWKGAMVGSNNWGAVQCGRNAQNAPNCVEYEDSYPDGTRYKISFRTYETPKDGAKDMLKHIFSYRSTGKSLDGGDVFRGSYSMRREVYYGGFCPKATKQYGAQAVNESVRFPDKNDATKACAKEAITTHAQVIKGYIDDIAYANQDPYALGLGTYEAADAWWADKTNQPPAEGAIKGDAKDGDWQKKGADQAQTANKEQQELAGSPLISSELGKALLAAQASMIKATQAAISKMASTPPLALMVNPSSFSVKGEKIVNDGSWGRNGPIIEYWGDQQDKISGSGRLAGFYAIDVLNGQGPGITRWARNFSAAYQNFQSLYQLYRNNGAIFLPDGTTWNTTQNMSMLGSIYIFYDNVIYIGSFDSFNVTENDNAPHTIEYNFEFTVRAAFLLDKTDDAFDYGVPQIRPSGTVPVQSTSPLPPGGGPQPVQQPFNPSTIQDQVDARVETSR